MTYHIAKQDRGVISRAMIHRAQLFRSSEISVEHP